jgi:hypothetical protein
VTIVTALRARIGSNGRHRIRVDMRWAVIDAYGTR